jgi:hypothetical protein
MRDVLRVIGRNLISLELRKMSVEEIDGVVEYCPNLQYLNVTSRGVMNGERVDEVKQILRNGLKRLAKLKVHGAIVRYWRKLNVEIE